MKIRALMIATLTSALFLATGCPGDERPETDGGTSQPDAGVCGPDTPYDTPSPSQTPEREDGQPPRLDCVTTPEVWPQSLPVTMHGCLDVFGLGSRVVSTSLMIAAYAIDQDPSSEQPAHGEVGIETTSPEAVDCEKGAYYSLDNIPASTPLLIKVWDSVRDDSMIVVDSYQFGVLLDPTDIEFGNKIEFEANVVYSATYTALPTTAGQPIEGWDNLTDGVGRAILAGEAQDCDEKPISNIMVTGPCIDARAKVAYTVGEDCDQPDRSLSSTSDCGIYGVLNIAPGWHKIEAFVNTGSGVHTLGVAEVHVFPDSVTIFSPRGLPPSVGDVDAGAMPDAAAPDAAEADAAAPDAAVAEDGGAEDAA